MDMEILKHKAKPLPPTKDNILFIISLLTTFAGVILYGERRLEDVEASARAELRENVKTLDSRLVTETQQRREDIREVNSKLDKIIFLLTRRP